MCIRDRPEPWIPLPANGSQNHHHIPPAAGERETCTHATASTTGGPHTPRSAGPFPSPKYFLCPLCPITEPAGGPSLGESLPAQQVCCCRGSVCGFEPGRELGGYGWAGLWLPRLPPRPSKQRLVESNRRPHDRQILLGREGGGITWRSQSFLVQVSEVGDFADPPG